MAVLRRRGISHGVFFDKEGLVVARPSCGVNWAV